MYEKQFLVTEFNILKTISNTEYIEFQLINNSYPNGIKGKLWDQKQITYLKKYNTKKIVVDIKYKELNYDKFIELDILKLKIVSKEEIDDNVYVISDLGVRYLTNKLGDYVKEIKNIGFQNLVNELVCEEGTWEKLIHCPTIKDEFHSFRTGLLEHIIGMLGLARNILNHATSYNKDLIYTSIIFHNIGYIYILDEDGNYTDKGKLLNNNYLSCNKVSKLSNVIREKNINFSIEEEELLINIIICNSNRNIESVIPESYLLNYIDDLDIEMKRIHLNLESSFNKSGKLLKKHKLYNRNNYYFNK